MADIAESGCLILWGYNPSFSRITHATATVAGLKRGMKLIVIDPRNVGLANKADVWLRVRPGTDGALALGLANVMIEREWFDQEFVRAWSNGPLLVRSDTDRLLKAEDLVSGSRLRTICCLGFTDPTAPLAMIRSPDAMRHPASILPCEANTSSQRSTVQSAASLFSIVMRRYAKDIRPK